MKALTLAYIEKIKALTLWGWLSAYFISLLAPLGPAVLPIILFTVLDIITGIKASQYESKNRNVITSKSRRTKLELLNPFVLGLLAIRLCEHSIPGLDGLEIMGFQFKMALTNLYLALFFLNECISILENVSRTGYTKVLPIINFLRIKTEQIDDKLKGDKNEPQK